MGLASRLRVMTEATLGPCAVQVVFRTRMLVHDYNTPFQLGTNCR